MPDLRLDDCEHCACLTPLCGYTRTTAIAELEGGGLGCWNCHEGQDDGEGGDGHYACVVLYDGDDVVWDGRCKRGGKWARK